MVDIRKSTHRHRHHARCIHSNTLVLLSLRLSRLYSIKNTCAPYTFIRLLTTQRPHSSVHHSVAVARERTCYPEDLPTRQSSIQSQSLKSARVTQKTTRESARSHQSLDGATVTLRLLSASRCSCKTARATGTGCRSRPWAVIREV